MTTAPPPTSAPGTPPGAEVSPPPLRTLPDRDVLDEHRLRRARLVTALHRGGDTDRSGPTWRLVAGSLVLCLAALGGTAVGAVVTTHLPDRPSLARVERAHQDSGGTGAHPEEDTDGGVGVAPDHGSDVPAAPTPPPGSTDSTGESSSRTYVPWLDQNQAQTSR